jgi:hypothetical protein
MPQTAKSVFLGIYRYIHLLNVRMYMYILIIFPVFQKNIHIMSERSLGK